MGTRHSICFFPRSSLAWVWHNNCISLIWLVLLQATSAVKPGRILLPLTIFFFFILGGEDLLSVSLQSSQKILMQNFFSFSHPLLWDSTKLYLLLFLFTTYACPLVDKENRGSSWASDVSAVSQTQQTQQAIFLLSYSLAEIWTWIKAGYLLEVCVMVECSYLHSWGNFLPFIQLSASGAAGDSSVKMFPLPTQCYLARYLPWIRTFPLTSLLLWLLGWITTVMYMWLKLKNTQKL